MIGYQGIPGSYSEVAVQCFIKDSEIGRQVNHDFKQFENFHHLIEALIHETIEYAVIPVENSTTGLITRSMDLFRYQPLLAIEEYYLPIQHVLWGIPGAKLEEITQVFSHPEALSQCQRFFKHYPAIEERPYLDTALSAKKIAKEGLKHQAALASSRAGELFGLVRLKDKIQNETTNQTRFLVMTRQELKWNDVKHHHLLLYVETPHEPGALMKLLQVFNVFQCNLEALNARPIQDKPFHYGFYIEINTKQMIGGIEALGTLISSTTTYYQILGNFSSKRPEMPVE